MSDLINNKEPHRGTTGNHYHVSSSSSSHASLVSSSSVDNDIIKSRKELQELEEQEKSVLLP